MTEERWQQWRRLYCIECGSVLDPIFNWPIVLEIHAGLRSPKVMRLECPNQCTDQSSAALGRPATSFDDCLVFADWLEAHGEHEKAQRLRTALEEW